MHRAGDIARKLEAQGLSFHARDKYWKEDACYLFDLKQVETVEAATNELHQMCIAALENAIDTERLGRLADDLPVSAADKVGLPELDEPLARLARLNQIVRRVSN